MPRPLRRNSIQANQSDCFSCVLGASSESYETGFMCQCFGFALTERGLHGLIQSLRFFMKPCVIIGYSSLIVRQFFFL